MVTLMKNNEGKLLKLTSAFFYKSDIEPEVINLRETTVAIGIAGVLSGYHGAFSHTKGFKPIKELADMRGERYTIIDFTLRVHPFSDSSATQEGMLLNFKQMTKAQIQPIYDEIACQDPFLVEKIKSHSGMEKALIDCPQLLADILPNLTSYQEAVFMHTIKPSASPTLVVASIHPDQISKLVISASCRFNRNCKVIW